MARSRRNYWRDDSEGHRKAIRKALKAGKKVGWYDESERHSLAAKKGWETRRKGTKRRRRRTKKNAWYDASEAHSIAAKKGWARRRRVRRNPAGYGFGSIVDYAKATFTLENVGGAAAGVVATIAVPKIIGWNSGWKDIVASGATTIVGGVVISHFNNDAGKAFAIAGAGITGLKIIRLLLGHTKIGAKFSAKYLQGSQEDVISEDILENVESLADFGQDEEDITDEDLFGVGEDEEDLFEGVGEKPLEPTFTGTE